MKNHLAANWTPGSSPTFWLTACGRRFNLTKANAPGLPYVLIPGKLSWGWAVKTAPDRACQHCLKAAA